MQDKDMLISKLSSTFDVQIGNFQSVLLALEKYGYIESSRSEVVDYHRMHIAKDFTVRAYHKETKFVKGQDFIFKAFILFVKESYDAYGDNYLHNEDERRNE